MSIDHDDLATDLVLSPAPSQVTLVTSDLPQLDRIMKVRREMQTIRDEQRALAGGTEYFKGYHEYDGIISALSNIIGRLV